MSCAQIRWASPCNEANAQCRSLWGKTTYFSVIWLRLVSAAWYLIIQSHCLRMLFALLKPPAHTPRVHTYMQLPVFVQVQLGSTVVNSSFSFKSRPARVLLSRIKYTFVITSRKRFNTRTRSPASRNLGSMSQCWPCTTGAELSQRNFSFEKQLDWSTVTTTLLFESKRQRIANTSL